MRMKNAILISIHPEWCRKIISGEKTFEIRKNFPRRLKAPYKCYMYVTRTCLPPYSMCSILSPSRNTYEADGKIVAEWNCDVILDICLDIKYQSKLMPLEVPFTCLTDRQIIDYLGNGKKGYMWHINDLKVYDSPLTLSDFGLKRAPQSWCYVEDITE